MSKQLELDINRPAWHNVDYSFESRRSRYGERQDKVFKARQDTAYNDSLERHNDQGSRTQPR